ncbi:hypothetical protein [Sphingosinicella sp. BN140058]|uniref:hypothetical protein n=1 Tax=Sphingosinicella sp. BN140058 TaxID=1892855 RepID=UPI0013EBA8E4|nr:hypothetical protein [Sphingosinicella sp. BN140058]
MKSAFAGFALTAALLLVHASFLPTAGPTADGRYDGGIAERHSHEDKAAVEQELGLVGA